MSLDEKDPRKGNSFYYDLDAEPLDDLPFYLQQVDINKSVLELGAGTGRILIPLAAHCKEIVGVDYSADMVERCEAKLRGLSSNAIRATMMVGDITHLDLLRKFDLIIAPYRVMQALETDDEVKGFFDTIRRHLLPTGKAIVNVFKPNREKAEMCKNWCQPHESICWEKTLPDASRVLHSEWYEKMDKERMVLYPQLIYRKYRGTQLLEEFIQMIKMRCYYPDEFQSLIQSHGFKISNCWGGYAGESYGHGRELVVEFSAT